MTVAEIDPGKDHPERYLEASRRIMARIAELEAPQVVSEPLMNESKQRQ